MPKPAATKATGGVCMPISQGVTGVKYWTGVDADPSSMRSKLEEIFGV